MPTPRTLTPQDYVAMLRRRWYLIAAPAIVGLVIGYGLIRVLPRRYTSQSLMLVERQQVPHDFVEPIITEDLNARIANIEEQTLSRTRLEPIIERYHLFAKDAAKSSIDGLVLRLQKAVTLTPLKPVIKTEDETIPGFYLSVTLNEPRTAQQVCAEIASMFVDEDIRQRQRSAEGTTSFLESTLADAKQKLDEQDARLAAFEGKYMGMLPDETKTNLSMLGTLNTQLQAVTQELNRAVQDKAYAQSVLAQQVQAWKLTEDMKNGYIPEGDHNPLLDQLAALQTQLANLKGRYTEQYPDVIKTEASIADLKKQIQGSSRPATSKPGGTAKAAAAIDPPQIQQLRGQVRAYDVTIKTDAGELQQLKAAVKSYESRLQLSPVIEEEYKKITRDHDTALKFYNSLLAKRDQSEMASELERRQEGEQLSVMDPANLPDAPSYPKPPLFIGGGFAAGLVLGLAAVLGIERNDKRIRTGRDVEYYLGTMVFAAIPSIEVTALENYARLPSAASPPSTLSGS
ncbi:MAG: GumC family protein [Terriglobia bacterium]